MFTFLLVEMGIRQRVYLIRHPLSNTLKYGSKLKGLSRRDHISLVAVYGTMNFNPVTTHALTLDIPSQRTRSSPYCDFKIQCGAHAH